MPDDIEYFDEYIQKMEKMKPVRDRVEAIREVLKSRGELSAEGQRMMTARKERVASVAAFKARKAAR